MFRNLTLPLLFICAIVVSSLFFSSCTSTKHIKYFEDIPDSGVLKPLKQADYIEPKIQVDDILTIIVQTVDPLATVAINAGNVATSPTGISTNPSLAQAATPVSGYLVGKDGDVELPIIGRVHLLGLTSNEARDLIRSKAIQFFKEPSVIVRYANFKVIVAGEVTKPSAYVVPNEKVSILDALAMAGDLTIYGKRDNILLLRDNLDGTKTAYRINLNKTDLLSQPYYYLHQNDYIYVEPSKGKIAANDLSQTKTIAIAGSILSLLIIIASRVK
jgi:polysaccharide export outer membrane protein